MSDCGARLELRRLRLEDEASFQMALADAGAEQLTWEFAIGYTRAGSFTDYVSKLGKWEDGIDLPAGFVPSTFLVGVVGGAIVGRVSIRHQLNDFLERIGGHVGYGVIPSCRGRGYATQMLKLALPVCADLRLARILLTCDLDNEASVRVIEKCGGVFEGLTNCPELSVQKRRYWISIPESLEGRMPQPL